MRRYWLSHQTLNVNRVQIVHTVCRSNCFKLSHAVIPGKNIAHAFLSPLFRHCFSRVVVFTRDTSSPAAKELTGNGANVVKVILAKGDVEGAAALKTALRRCRARDHGMDVLAKASIDPGVKVYLPSEFGADRRLDGFDDFNMP